MAHLGRIFYSLVGSSFMEEMERKVHNKKNSLQLTVIQEIIL